MTESPSPLEGLVQHVLDADEINVLVATSKKRDDPVEFHRLQFGEELQEEFRDAALVVLDDPDDVILVPYDAVYQPAFGELLCLRLDDAPRVEELIRDAVDVSACADFHPEDSLIRQLRFYVTVISDEERDAAFFRAFTSSKELTRRKGFVAVFEEGVFEKVTHKTFLFDDDADCFSWNGYLFIRHKSAFERIFRYLDELRRAADETLDNVLQYVPVSNEAEFREACKGQIQMLAKLASVSRKPYLTDLTIDIIEETIGAFELNVVVQDQNGAKRLVFDPSTQESRWAILKLLDDDYLQSVMTEEKYEATSKIRVR